MATLKPEDYEATFRWYVDTVLSCEGVDFLPDERPLELTPEQWHMLATQANKMRHPDSPIPI